MVFSCNELGGRAKPIHFPIPIINGKSWGSKPITLPKKASPWYPDQKKIMFFCSFVHESVTKWLLHGANSWELAKRALTRTKKSSATTSLSSDVDQRPKMAGWEKKCEFKSTTHTSEIMLIYMGTAKNMVFCAFGVKFSLNPYTLKTHTLGLPPRGMG